MIQTYRKRPVNIQAGQWFKHGDHPEVLPGPIRFASDEGQTTIITELEIQPQNGWINTLENAHEVTPGDFIIRGVRGEFYPCKPDIFAETYELVDVEDVIGNIDIDDGA